jgi:predicted lipid carrier protein YhbT
MTPEGDHVATAQECQEALETLAARTAARDNADLGAGGDRSLSCTVRDLDVVFGGSFKNGQLVDVHQVDNPPADIRFELTSDDLLALVDGRLNVTSAWATGRIKLHAGVRDLMRLRSMF